MRLRSESGSSPAACICWLGWTHKVDDVKLVNHLKETEVAPSPLSICGVKRSYAPGFVIGFQCGNWKAAPDWRALASALADHRQRESSPLQDERLPTGAIPSWPQTLHHD
jgi:hypothetical protein